ncbi:hypothetical protein SAMN06272735_8163 [Streptomyces sp. TLI_55]|uniref:hypothetical protein n=1 Tax=Streptomyces sp. TLI_55 TaxID=1938861 RepID=UPI000BDD0A0D|nr:hypothetical protein [Streptomyces sp. TLI_55]SNX66313.1 hypothetical protein SAMN06272735_8163 [Streptomyces sp. TLI_55]
MRNSSRYSAAAALIASATLLATGCSAADETSTENTAPTVADASPTTTTSTTTGTAGSARSGKGAAADEHHGKTQAVVAADTKGASRGAAKSTLKVVSYDRSSGRAVVAGKSKSAAAVSTGDVIASPPTADAPHGLLVKVTKVLDSTSGGTEVQTVPATLREALGTQKVQRTVTVAPSDIQVKPLGGDVQVSDSKTLDSLRVDVSRSVSGGDDPVTASATISGYVELTPTVEFSYDGSSSGTDSASLALSGEWSSQLKLEGQVAASAGTQVPFAQLTTDETFYVGDVPVVVNLSYVLYYEVEADGKVTVAIGQSTSGDFKTGGTYTKDDGWTPVSEADMKVSAVDTSVTAAGHAKATLGAKASVGLYGAVGVNAELAPYVRAAAESDLVGKTYSWATYGGYDLNGTLEVDLSEFGVPIDESVPLVSVHEERELAPGSGSLTSR